MAFEACMATLKIVVNVVGENGRTLNRKEQLRHRAFSLRQHGFLVLLIITSLLLKSNLHALKRNCNIYASDN